MNLKYLVLIVLILIGKKSICQDNYLYDQQGRLINDHKEGIILIEWNNKNQITRITRADTCNTPDLEFAYDLQGNRIMKLVKPRHGNGIEPESFWMYTYYNYDSKGNCLAIHKREYQETSNQSYKETYSHSEQNLFTESRFGLERIDQVQFTQTFKATIGNDGRLDNISKRSSTIPVSISSKSAHRGNKMYETTNHLGNTLAVITDRKENSVAALRSATDYYPFGMTLADRKYEPIHRYGMNGQERIPELAADHYTARYWEYNSRLARRWNTDPVVVAAIAPYATFGNNPVRYMDKLGDKITGDLVRYYDVKMAVYNTLITHYKKLDEVIHKNNKTEKAWKDIDELHERIQGGHIALQELQVLENSEQEYHIGYGTTKHTNVAGITRFNTKTNAIDIVMTVNGDGKLKSPKPNGVLIHELKHAYQFESGELIYLYKSNEDGIGIKDEWDEPEAYARSQVVGEPHSKHTKSDAYYKRMRRDNINSFLLNKRGDPVVKFGVLLTHSLYLAGQVGMNPTYIFNGWQAIYNAGKNNAPIPLSEGELEKLEEYLQTK